MKSLYHCNVREGVLQALLSLINGWLTTGKHPYVTVESSTRFPPRQVTA